MSVTIKSKNPPGYNIFLLGGAIRLGSGESITLSNDQFEHSSVKAAIQCGSAEVVSHDPGVEVPTDLSELASKIEKASQEKSVKVETKPKAGSKTQPKLKEEVNKEVASQMVKADALTTVEVVDLAEQRNGSTEYPKD